MVSKSYRMLAFVLVFAVMFGLFAAMAPATAEASGMGGHPRYARQMHGHPMYMHGGKAYFKPNHLPRIVTRDFGSDCDWWRYELRGGRYVRVYCPCRYGDQEVDYGPQHRQAWAQSTGASQ